MDVSDHTRILNIAARMIMVLGNTQEGVSDARPSVDQFFKFIFISLNFFDFTVFWEVSSVGTPLWDILDPSLIAIASPFID